MMTVYSFQVAMKTNLLCYVSDKLSYTEECCNMFVFVMVFGVFSANNFLMLLLYVIYS